MLTCAGVVYNVFESVDVITLIKGGFYDDLSLTVGEALKKRSPVCDLSSYDVSCPGHTHASIRASRASIPVHSTMDWTLYLTLSANPEFTVSSSWMSTLSSRVS
jgi:hypothetical protein